MSVWDAVLSNPLQAIAATIAAFSSVLAVFVYLKNRKIKSFRYSLLTNIPLLSIADELNGKIKIYYEESPDNNIQIKDSSLIIIKFVNDGNTPIKSVDFEGPIQISFKPEVEVLSAEIAETNPVQLNPKIYKSKNQISLEPLLLNKGDSLTLKALITGSKENIDVVPTARIVGVNEIKPLEPRTKRRNWALIIENNKENIPALVAVLGAVMAGLISLNSFSMNISVMPDQVVLPIGDEKVVDIYVEGDTIADWIMGERQTELSADLLPRDQNIDITIKPPVSPIIPFSSTMAIRAKPNAKAGIHRIAIFAERSFMFRSFKELFLIVVHSPSNES